MNREHVASPSETIEALLRTAGRIDSRVPIRRSFLQQHIGDSPAPGPLAEIVNHRDVRGLDLYMILKATASKEPWSSRRNASVWARALQHTGVTADPQAVSKIWNRLDTTYGLIERRRVGRLVEVTLLREDGTGAQYSHPGTEGEAYLQLPVAYWLDSPPWCRTLSLRAKALLLVALSLRPGFILPVEKGPEWYGVSADTAQRGLHELVQIGLLERVRRYRKAPLAPEGFTYDSHYTLTGPFERQVPNSGEATNGN